MQLRLIRTCFLLLFLLFLAGSSSAQFCKNNKRIHPVTYPAQYWPIHCSVKHDASKSLMDQLRNCSDSSKNHDEEVCAHNRFMYTDHVLYYRLSERYKARSERLDSFEVALGALRDSLYKEWMLTLPEYNYTGYFEWETEDLKGLSLEAFQAKGSENFRQLATVSKVLNRPPPKRKKAKALVHQTLKGRSPFSAIFPYVAFDLMQTPGMAEALECSIERMTKPDDDQHLFEILSECCGSEEQALYILGALASQRMYLIRDWREWMLQNQTKEVFDANMKVLALASELHFRMETMGRQFGAERLYPKELDASEGSTKAYHFWSAALLAHILAKNGCDEEVAIKEATKPAKRYKRFIQFPGFAYNILLLKHPVSGTTADYSNVINEQRAGAAWGFQLKGD